MNRPRNSIIAALTFIGLFVSLQPVRANPIQVPSGTPTTLQAPINVDVPDTTLSLTGCASPNAFVTIFDGNEPAGTVVADSNGRFTKKITANQSGLHNIRLYYDDVNGRTSSIITKNISLTPHSNTAFDLLLPTTIEHEPEPVRVGNYLIFRGTTCPSALVNVTLNNNFTMAAKADQRGNWYAIADTEDYYIGAHTYTAVSSLNNRTSDVTQKYQFNTAGPSAGGVPAPAELTTPVITEPVDNFLSSSPLVTFRGSGPTTTAIEIFIDGEQAGAVYTNALGEFTFQLSMFANRHVVTVRACQDKTCTDFSNEVAVRYAGNLDSCSMRFGLGEYRFFGLAPDDGVDLLVRNLMGLPAYDVLLDWGDASVEHFNLANDDSVRLHHVYKQQGLFNGSITLKDSRGCTYTQYFTVEVARDAQTNWLWYGLIASVGTGLLIAGRHFAWLARFRGSRVIKVILPHLYQPYVLPGSDTETEPVTYSTKN